MKKYWIWFLCLIVFGCINSMPRKNEVEKLTVKFEPSLGPDHSSVIIKMGKDSGEMSYTVFTPRNPTTGQTPSNKHFDSLKLKVGGPAYLKLAALTRTINFNHASCNFKNSPPGGLLDPNRVEVQYISSVSDTSECDCSSPIREFCPLIYQFLDGFFEFADSTLTGRKRVEYLEELKNLFGYSFRIKKLSDLPLEYGFWGLVSEKEQPLLLDFIERLPINQAVMIDVNYAFIKAPKTARLIKRKLQQNRDIYWICEEYSYGAIFLENIGIKKRYENREAALKKILSTANK